MSKCTCSIHAGSAFGLCPIIDSEDKSVTYPKSCLECGEKVKNPEDFGRILRLEDGNVGICKICMEILKCFFCTCSINVLWSELRKNYKKLPLGKLREILSEEATQKLVQEVDKWIAEDNS